jgi:hypothetical protein
VSSRAQAWPPGSAVQPHGRERGVDSWLRRGGYSYGDELRAWRGLLARRLRRRAHTQALPAMADQRWRLRRRAREQGLREALSAADLRRWRWIYAGHAGGPALVATTTGARARAARGPSRRRICAPDGGSALGATSADLLSPARSSASSARGRRIRAGMRRRRWGRAEQASSPVGSGLFFVFLIY